VFADNGSTDDSINYLENTYGHLSNLKIVLNGKNYGYSGGNNLAIHQATGEYVLVCNNDLELQKSLLRELMQVALEHDADAVVPKLMYLNKPGIINNAGSRLEPNDDWPVYEIGANEKDNGQYDSVREVSAVCGACVLFKRSFLEQVGLFDAKFFMYFEDSDLSWRGQKQHKKFFYAPRAVAFHFHTGSSKEGSPLFNHYVGRNRLLILTKNASFRVIAKGWYKTLRDHLALRVKNLVKACYGKYRLRLALIEFVRSQHIIWAALWLTPYTLLKRYGILNEDHL
jgi:GT2 family glycosyltransferase